MTKSRKLLSKREIMMGFVTLLVMVVGYLKFGYAGRQKQFAEQDLEIATLEQDLQRNKLLVTELQQRNVASVSGQNSDPQVQMYLSNNQRFAQTIANVAAVDPQLLTKAVVVEKNDNRSDFTETLFTVQVEGSFLAIGAFVERFEESSLLAEIEEMELKHVETDLTRVIARLKIRSYIKNETDDD